MFKRRLSRHVQFIHHGKANTSMPTIVLCRPLHASGMALLEARHDVAIRTLNRPSPKDLAEAMPGAHAVLVGLEVVDEALLAASPELRIVSRFGVGYDTVDIPACTRRGVVVGVTNGGNDLSVA
jgi:D-3-phosphoglycerate dehydrogenase